MSNRNDITGDKLITKTLSKEGQANWDTIFPPKKKEPIKLTQHEYNNIETIEALIDSHDKKKLAEYELNKSTGEVQKVDVKKLTEAHNGH